MNPNKNAVGCAPANVNPRHSNWRTGLLASAPLAAILFGAGGAWAQAAPTPARSISEIEEVVVTARKRDESLQTVPVAVTAATAEQLEQQGVRQPTDMARIVPSLSVNAGQNSPTGAVFNIRGQVAADITLNLSQAVGLYEDNVSIPHPEGSNLSFFDLSRIEVLKGPQGTLYGRNTTGGAVNIITRDADFAGIHGNVMLEAGNYGHLKYSGAINVPIQEDILAARIAYQHWDRDGYGESRITGQKFGGVHDDDTARLSLNFTPAPFFTAEVKAEYAQAKISDLMQTLAAFTPNASAITEGVLQRGGNPASPTDRAAVVAIMNQAIGTGDYQTNSQGTNVFNEVKVWHGVLDLNWDISDTVQLRSVSGYHKFEDFRTFDLDGLPWQVVEPGAGTDGIIPAGGKILRPLPPEGISTVYSQEFNLSGDFGIMDWLVGAYMSSEEGEGGHVTIALPYAQSLLPTSVDSNGNRFRPIGSTYATFVGQESWALFTQNDFKFSDVVSLTLGARYTEERLKQTVNFFTYESVNANVANDAGPYLCALPDQGSPPGTPPRRNLASPESCLINKSAVFSGTSYLASLNLQFTPEMLVYLKTARGFRGGALQLRSPAAAAAAPEIATDYEIGFKNDFLDGRLRTNIAVYQTNYTNKQETVIESDGVNPTPVTVVRNAADARIRGVEAEVRARPMEGLTTYGTLTYLDGQYLDYPRAVTSTGVINGSGVEFAIPKWAYSLGARYEMDAGPGRLGLQADWSWRDKTPLTKLSISPVFPIAVQERLRDAVGLLNLRADYAMDQYGVTVSVFATNALNEEYQRAGVDLNSSGGILAAVTAEPRMWGVSVTKTFGDE